MHFTVLIVALLLEAISHRKKKTMQNIVLAQWGNKGGLLHGDMHPIAVGISLLDSIGRGKAKRFNTGICIETQPMSLLQ